MLKLVERTVVSCIVLALFAQGARSVELSREVETGRGYTVRLPADWVQIPKEVLEEHFDQLISQGAVPEEGRPDLVFQRDAGGEWFQVPFMSITEVETGRVSEAELEQVEKFQKGFARGMSDSIGTHFEGVSANLQGDMQYDPEAHLLLTVVQVDGLQGGTCPAFLAIKLTAKGEISMLFVVDPAEFESYLELFEAIARGLEVDPALDYNANAPRRNAPRRSASSVGRRRRNRRDLDFSRFMGRIGGMALLAVVVVLLVKKVRRPTRSTPSAAEKVPENSEIPPPPPPVS